MLNNFANHQSQSLVDIGSIKKEGVLGNHMERARQSEPPGRQLPQSGRPLRSGTIVLTDNICRAPHTLPDRSNTVGSRTAPRPTPIPIPRTIVRYGSWPPSRTVGTFGSVSTSPGVKKVKYATARMTAMTNIVSTNLIIPPLAFCSVSVMPSTTWIRRRSSPAGHTSRLPRGDPCSRSKVFHRNSRSALYFFLQKEH